MAVKNKTKDGKGATFPILFGGFSAGQRSKDNVQKPLKRLSKLLKKIQL